MISKLYLQIHLKYNLKSLLHPFHVEQLPAASFGNYSMLLWSHLEVSLFVVLALSNIQKNISTQYPTIKNVNQNTCSETGNEIVPKSFRDLLVSLANCPV